MTSNYSLLLFHEYMWEREHHVAVTAVWVHKVFFLFANHRRIFKTQSIISPTSLIGVCLLEIINYKQIREKTPSLTRNCFPSPEVRKWRLQQTRGFGPKLLTPPPPPPPPIPSHMAALWSGIRLEVGGRWGVQETSLLMRVYSRKGCDENMTCFECTWFPGERLFIII